MWISLSIKFPICVDDEKEIQPKPYHGLPQASHEMCFYLFYQLTLLDIIEEYPAHYLA